MKYLILALILTTTSAQAFQLDSSVYNQYDNSNQYYQQQMLEQQRQQNQIMQEQAEQQRREYLRLQMEQNYQQHQIPMLHTK